MSTSLIDLEQLDVLVDRIARRVVELLDERAGAQNVALVDAATIGRLLGISRETVYEHRDELGAVRVGDGPRPRLRFDPLKARQAWTAGVGRGVSLPADPPEVEPPRRKPRRRRQAAARPDLETLPVLGARPPDEVPEAA